MNIYTSYEVDRKARKVERQRQNRMAKARRFDAMCRQLGYTRAAAAKALQVSERTLHNWVSGTTAVPYAAYKLLRVLCFHEIPFQTWHGWHFAGGKLWSPEGYGFTGLDGSWWSLLVRQARSSGVLFEQQREFRAIIDRLRAELAAIGQAPMQSAALPARGDPPAGGGWPAEPPAFTVDPLGLMPEPSGMTASRLGRLGGLGVNSHPSPMVITGRTIGVTTPSDRVAS